ncbi:MAG: hypothetical protein U0T74_03645 [Chitinophagales bacterium]
MSYAVFGARFTTGTYFQLFPAYFLSPLFHFFIYICSLNLLGEAGICTLFSFILTDFSFYRNHLLFFWSIASPLLLRASHFLLRTSAFIPSSGVCMGSKTGVFRQAENVIRPGKPVIRPWKPVNGIILQKIWIGLLRFVRRE